MKIYRNSRLTKDDVVLLIKKVIMNGSIPINKMIREKFIGTIFLGFNNRPMYTTRLGNTGEIHNLQKSVLIELYNLIDGKE